MKYFNAIFNRKRKNIFNLFEKNSQNTDSLIVKNNIEQWQDCGDVFLLT